ncbi:MAG: diacylglycerol kinase family protein [Clostridiales bacterium]|nr:diacylglycerol kinase family protein [Clostridiales bacterium]
MSMTRQERVALLFNPAAGKGRAIKAKYQLDRILHKHEILFDLYITQSVQDLRELARRASLEYETLVGVGGDSTFQIIIDEVMKTGGHPKLGLIGLGSSNDIAREFRVESLNKACSALRKGEIKTIDLGCLGLEEETLLYFLGQANIGLGALVNQYIEELSDRKPRLGKRQKIAGLFCILNAQRSGKVPLRLTIDSVEGRTEGEFAAAVFSNIRYWATGRLINPGARVDDGYLDACLIRACSLPRLLHLALLAKNGKHITATEAVFLRSPVFTIRSEQQFTVQADGEIVGGWRTPTVFSEIQVRAIPGALKLICRGLTQLARKDIF